jgi:hypothetical protein
VIILAEPKVTTEIIGPEDASFILDNHNKRNRRSEKKTVDEYARAMTNDEWHFIGDPVRFDKDGNLLDGQQRLAAVAQSGCPQTFVVIRNLERDDQRYMDGGRKRTAIDQLRIEGLTNAAVIAGIASLFMHWQADDLPWFNIKFSTFEVVEWVESNLDSVEAAAKHADSCYRATRASKSIMGAAYLVFSAAADVDTATEFMNLIATGAGLDTGSPVLLLRQKMVEWANRRPGQRPQRHEMLYFVVRTWNAWRKGEKLTKLQIPVGGEINMAHLRARR